VELGRWGAGFRGVKYVRERVCQHNDINTCRDNRKVANLCGLSTTFLYIMI
jgi:hypothetical protein